MFPVDERCDKGSRTLCRDKRYHRRRPYRRRSRTKRSGFYSSVRGFLCSGTGVPGVWVIGLDSNFSVWTTESTPSSPLNHPPRWYPNSTVSLHHVLVSRRSSWTPSDASSRPTPAQGPLLVKDRPTPPPPGPLTWVFRFRFRTHPRDCEHLWTVVRSHIRTK